eukprot:scaffold171475_cov31-Tisochrysis_lutea.AAC.1
MARGAAYFKQVGAGGGDHGLWTMLNVKSAGGRSTQKGHMMDGHGRRTSGWKTEAGKDNHGGEKRGNTQGNKRGGRDIDIRSKVGEGGT